MIVHYNCRHFLGSKPCAFRRACEGCPHFAPFGTRVLIIKLAAMGDVLRTTPLLRGLRATTEPCHVTWLTEPNVIPMLAGVEGIHRLLPYTAETVLALCEERFDRLYCFDKEPKATALAMRVQANQKAGFGMSPYGNVMPLSRESEYTFALGIDDDLKFRVNRKTYPELVFECAGIPWEGPQEYILPDLSAEIEGAARRLEAAGVARTELRVGLNTGAGDVFATKKWTEDGFARLARRLTAELGARVLLLGGPAERERNARIAATAGVPVVDTGSGNPIRDFAGIAANLDLMVTGDTLAMHVAIGLKVPVLVILGPTCHQEIELYGRGAKIVSDFECSPCYLGRCPKEVTCMDATTVERVFEEAARLVRRHASGKTRTSIG